MEAPKTCVLKLNIHCEGCQKDVSKILQKIHGVYSFNIDAEQNKVTVSGTVDPNILIMLLAKAGKRAQILFEQPPTPPAPPPPPPTPHPHHIDLNFKNLHMGPPQAQPKPSGGGAIAQLQQLAQFKKLKHMELTQSRGIKLTFRRKHKDKMGIGNNDPHMKIHMNDGHGHGHGHGHGPGPGHPMNMPPPPPHHDFNVNHGGAGHGHPMNMPPPPPHHNFTVNHGGAGPSGTKPPGPPPPSDPFSTFFSDENANGCSIM